MTYTFNDILKMKYRFEADSDDARLTGIEVSPENFEALRKEGEHYARWFREVRGPTLMVIDGITITKREPPLSPAMVAAGADAMRTWRPPIDDCETLAAIVYRAMEQAK